MLTKQEDKILLQRVMGKTTCAIARDTGITEAEVERIIADHTDSTLVADIRKKSLALDLTRLDLLLKVCMSRAVRGNMQAVLAALKIIQRRCTMLGLHTPQLHTLQIVDATTPKQTSTDRLEAALNALVEDQRSERPERENPH